MARAPLIRTNEYPYHINARANNQEWFYLDKDKCWQIFCYYLQKTQEKFGLTVHAFIMMSNHIHLIASTPNSNLDRAMHYFMMMTSRKIGMESQRINRIWGSRYYKCLITTEEYYAHAVKYLYMNPIEAGICTKAETYKWSTLKKENYKIHKNLIIENREGFDVFIPENFNEFIVWINKDVDVYYTEQIKKAIKKNVFKFAKPRGGNENYFKKFIE